MRIQAAHGEGAKGPMPLIFGGWKMRDLIKRGRANAAGLGGMFVAVPLAVPIAVLLAMTAQPAAAQIGDVDPATAAGSFEQPQTYQQTSTPRAGRDKDGDTIARERLEFDQNMAACDAGDNAACRRLGAAYEFGRGTPQVRSVAAILYTEGCTAGDAESCTALGYLKRISNAPEDREAATLDFQRACDLGSASGCLQLGRARKTGYGIESDLAEAERLLRLSCDQGADDACRQLAGFLIEENRGEPTTSEGIAILTRECEAGGAYSCTSLAGLRYRDEPPAGLPDPARVAYLGCSAGDSGFCKSLGDYAMLGAGVMQDRAYALTAYDRACGLNDKFCELASDNRTLPALTDQCNAGDIAVCTKVGTIYQSGNTVYSSDESAFNFLSYACENAQFDACYSAGISANSLYYTGSLQMWGRAQPFFEIGCENGDVRSCQALADGLKHGTTMTQDSARAYDLYARLCENDDRTSCELLEASARQGSDTPLALAGAVYDPPLTEEEAEEQRRQLIEEQDAFYNEQCDSNSVEFRGTVYSDIICNPAKLVVNGERLRAGQAPWQALLWRPERVRGISRDLQDHERVLCGGAVIRRGWILTAAHCLRDRGGSIAGRGYRVRLGVHNPRNEEGVSYPILSVHVHNRYRTSNYRFGFDIGLIRYDPGSGEQTGATNSIARIALDNVPVERRSINEGMPAYIYGWGLTGYRSGTSTDALRGARLELLTLDQCTADTNYRGAFLNSALCAAGAEGQQACSGDSGGPLVYFSDADRRPRVIGVVSSGFRCGEEGRVSRYTRVAAARAWIDRVMSGRR